MRGKAAILAMAALMFASAPGVAADSRKNKSSGGEALFRDGKIRTFRIEVPESGLRALKLGNKDYVRATLREGDTVLKEVGVRLKGHSTFQDIDRRPNFILKMNEFVSGQDYRGLGKLVLNNSAQDPGYVREIVAGEVFREAGIPAPMATPAKVELNGRDLGFYLLLEPINKGFLKREFGSAAGNLYEGESRDIDRRLDQENGDDTSQRDLATLASTLKAPKSVRMEMVRSILDVDQFATFLALEMLTASVNGYTYLRNNYRIYHEPKSDKLVFLPHGLEATFGSVGFKPPGGSLVVNGLWELPEFQRLYRTRLAELANRHWRVETLTNRIHTAAEKLVSAATDRKFAEQIQREELKLRKQIEQQHQLVQAEIRKGAR